MQSEFRLRWYGERGIVNALIVHIHRAADPVSSVQRLLATVQWADGSKPAWIDRVNTASLFVEWGWADFGNPDVLVVLETEDGVRCVVIEAKVVPYILSMRPNRPGMRAQGFNSSINGQLSLKYRFAKAVERATPEALVIDESAELLAHYGATLADPSSTPRRLAKAQVVSDVLRDNRLLGISEDRWSYVALTWDAGERVFFDDPLVAELGGVPCFLSESGENLITAMRSRLGWLGYQRVESALGLRDNPDYVAAFRTMQATNQPDEKDYEVVEANVKGGAARESVALATKLRHELFGGFDIVEYSGSYSIRQNGQTIAKIVPRARYVFVGVRDTKTPSLWFSGPLETMSVQGVIFLGVHVSVENPDTAEAERLARGLAGCGKTA